MLKHFGNSQLTPDEFRTGVADGDVTCGNCLFGMPVGVDDQLLCMRPAPRGLWSSSAPGGAPGECRAFVGDLDFCGEWMPGGAVNLHALRVELAKRARQ